MSRFEKICLAAAEMNGVEVIFIRFDGSTNDLFHDDGALHVRRSGTRAVFRLGFEDDPEVQNAITRAILATLGIPVTKAALAADTPGH
jgi:hypothetical protein